MGRSVMTHRDAEITIQWWYEDGHTSECKECDAYLMYKDFGWTVYEEPSPFQDDYETEWPEHEHEGWDFDQDNFMWLIEDLQESLKYWYPSLEPVDEWAGNEVHIIAQSALVEVSISEYSGMAALCVAPRDDEGDGYWEDVSGLAKRWIDQVRPKFIERFNLGN